MLRYTYNKFAIVVVNFSSTYCHGNFGNSGLKIDKLIKLKSVFVND